MVYSPVPPATAATPVTPNTTTPAPWVPYTRAGCNVGEVGTANSDLENTGFDIPKVFGTNSPENAQLTADTDSFKDQESADYVGIAVHCAKGSAFCTDATATKFGQSAPSKTASPDLLPDEPGGYNGYQALFGHKYVAPQLGAGTDNLTRDGYEITNAQGNLVDLNGNQINGDFLTNHPGFPGFGQINAGPVAGLRRRHAGVRRPGGQRLHRRHPRQRDIPGLAACNGAPAAPRQRQRLLHRPGAVLQPGLRRPSSSGWPPTASRRRTPCSS